MSLPFPIRISLSTTKELAAWRGRVTRSCTWPASITITVGPLKELLRQHPDLRSEEVYAALTYFYDHWDDMVAQLQTLAAAADSLTSSQDGPGPSC